MSDLNKEEILAKISQKKDDVVSLEETNQELAAENKRLNEKFDKLLMESIFLQLQKNYLKSVLGSSSDQNK